MNGYDVLFEHHKVLRGLCEKITAIAPETDERQEALDELLIELDIHMRIEDDLFYPAVSAATTIWFGQTGPNGWASRRRT